MLTDTQAQLVADAILLRHDEQPGHDLWFAADDDTVCEPLVTRGYLDERGYGNDRVYRATDQALAAQSLFGGQSPN
jgi:hypothetical protein